MPAGLGVGVGEFRKICQSGQVWMCKTDLAGMGDISSRWVRVCLHV